MFVNFFTTNIFQNFENNKEFFEILGEGKNSIRMMLFIFLIVIIIFGLL